MSIIGTIQLKGCLEPAADNQNFDLYAGEAKQLVVTVTDGYGNVIDLTGAKITWALEPNPTSTPASTTKSTTTGGITITNPTGGQFTVTLGSTDTAPLSPGSYFHAASIADASGNKTVVMTGYVTVSSMPANV